MKPLTPKQLDLIEQHYDEFSSEDQQTALQLLKEQRPTSALLQKQQQEQFQPTGFAAQFHNALQQHEQQTLNKHFLQGGPEKWLLEGFDNLFQGAQKLSQGSYAGGAADMLEGGAGVSTPFLGPAAMEMGMPKMLTSLAGGALGGTTADVLTQLALPDATEDQLRLARDLGTLPGAWAGGQPKTVQFLGGAAKALPQALTDYKSWGPAIVGREIAGPKGAVIASLPNILGALIKGGKSAITPNEAAAQVNQALGLQSKATDMMAGKGGEAPKAGPEVPDIYKQQAGKTVKDPLDALVKDRLIVRYLTNKGITKTKFDALSMAEKKALIKEVPSPNKSGYRWSDDLEERAAQTIRTMLPD